MEVHHTDSSDRTLLLYKNYSRNYHAVVVMWAIFSMCFVVIDVIAFAQPQWIGDTDDSLGVGYFGLFEFCELFSSGQELVCTGSLRQFGDIVTTPFKAATVLVGLSCILMMVCVVCFLLFFCIKKQFVLVICGCIQLLSGVLLFLGCIIYPLGWNSNEVRRICGLGAGQFDVGSCGVRWAYILAIIGIIDVIVLAILAFVLAGRTAHRPYFAGRRGSIGTKSDVYVVDSKSEPSMIIQPRVTSRAPSHIGTEYSHAPSHKRTTRKGDFSL